MCHFYYKGSQVVSDKTGEYVSSIVEDKSQRKGKGNICINNECQKEIRELVRENRNAFLVLSLFSEHMDSHNTVICSYKTIQEALGVGRTTASNAIKLLSERGFVRIEQDGRSNIYIVNSEIVQKM